MAARESNRSGSMKSLIQTTLDQDYAMSKRHALERAFHEALKTEIRWPQKGDKALTQAAEPADNASIAKDDHTRLVLMTYGYKKAAELMVEYAAENPSWRDSLVYPILFNYRHFIELSLKYQLATFGPVVGIEPNWDKHELEWLWVRFAEMLVYYGTSDPDEADPVVAGIVLEFAKIDPKSYSNRYPVDRHGNAVPLSETLLDLSNLADVMKA